MIEWRWPNIRLHEVQCHHCGELRHHEATYDAFEALRALLGGKPIAIVSGYRCPIHNKAVGGAQSSYHMLGQALDLSLQAVSTLEYTKLAQAITRAGFHGIGWYPQKRFVHVDTGPYRQWWGDE